MNCQNVFWLPISKVWALENRTPTRCSGYGLEMRLHNGTIKMAMGKWDFEAKIMHSH